VAGLAEAVHQRIQTDDQLRADVARREMEQRAAPSWFSALPAPRRSAVDRFADLPETA
jgi:hypothetical protein